MASTTKHQRSKKPAASNTSRLVLCAVLFSVFVFNPFAWLTDLSSIEQSPSGGFKLNTLAEHHVGSGRVLNSLVDEETNSTARQHHSAHQFELSTRLFRSALGWILNTILVLICLAFVYISGEARVDTSESEVREKLWARYERANKVWTGCKSYEDAHAHLRLGLLDLGQTCPRSAASLVLGIIWQLIRLALGRLLFDPRRRLGRILRWRPFDGHSMQQQQQQHRLTALFYYEMHKFAYLNMRHEQDFVPRTAVRIANLIGARDGHEDNDHDDIRVVIDRPYMTTYSYLTGVYYLLALYDQIEACQSSSSSLSIDEYELCEFYLAMVVFAKNALPAFVASPLVKFLVRRKLMSKLDLTRDEKQGIIKIIIEHFIRTI